MNPDVCGDHTVSRFEREAEIESSDIAAHPAAKLAMQILPRVRCRIQRRFLWVGFVFVFGEKLSAQNSERRGGSSDKSRKFVRADPGGAGTTATHHPTPASTRCSGPASCAFRPRRTKQASVSNPDRLPFGERQATDSWKQSPPKQRAGPCPVPLRMPELKIT